MVQDGLGDFARRALFELEGYALHLGELEFGAAFRLQLVIGLSGNTDDEGVFSDPSVLFQVKDGNFYGGAATGKVCGMLLICRIWRRGRDLNPGYSF